MSNLHLTLRQLQIFAAVADSGSTSSAAEKIQLSQSATSAGLIELERMLGLKLFDRAGKKLLLNDNGRGLLPRALSVLDGAGQIERWAQSGADQIGLLQIGASTTIGNYLLPKLLASFRDGMTPSARNDLDVKIVIANTATVVAQVAAFKIDFGLIEGPCNEKHIEVRPWLEDEMVIVCAPGLPISGSRRRPLSVEELSVGPWLLREPGSGTRESIDRLLEPHVHHLRAGIEFGNSEAIKRAAASGLGFACLSRYVVREMLRSGELREIKSTLPRLTRRFYLIIHERKQRSGGVDRMLRFLESLSNRNRSTRTI
jgi:DNA-binding transcriptional LysR family regulator